MNLFEQADELGTKIRKEREAKQKIDDAANQAKEDAVEEAQKKNES